ncbi:hypothetical protein OH77DRAFT_1460714 [Trametes cingulata]|nr:hypothetical protein OH77DRAFT_1460714 [Trametes cingulata]
MPAQAQLFPNSTPYPVNTTVWFLEGGKTRAGVVVDTETIEGLRFVIIKLNDGSPKPVKLPCVHLSAC